MISFFGSSKKRAKNRLKTCISHDRSEVAHLSREQLRLDIENVIKKYAELDGAAVVEISKTGAAGAYITAGAYLKNIRL